MAEISREDVLNDECLAIVKAGLEFYENCQELELDKTMEILEDIRLDEEDKRGISFFDYINPENFNARKAFKNKNKDKLVGVMCGMCYDPLLECNKC